MSRRSIRKAGFGVLLGALLASAALAGGGCGSTKAATATDADAKAKTLPRAASGESVDHGLVREGERLMVERAKRRGAVATPAAQPVGPKPAPAAASVPAR